MRKKHTSQAEDAERRRSFGNGRRVEERAQTAEQGSSNPSPSKQKQADAPGRKERNMLLSLNSSIGSKGPIRERAKVEISVVR